MIKVGSDFSGVGAFDQALMRLGIDYETVFACDWDKYARQTYIHNYGEPDYFPMDVYDREIPAAPLDIYMTSPPCQAFSLAGKRKGEDDKRGILFYNSHEFIKKNSPRYFIFENVKGLLSDDSGKTFRRWVEYLGGKSINGNPVLFPHPESVPYHIYWKVLNAKDYGIPQNRERVFIVGIRDDVDNNFTWPKEIFLEKRLRDVLEDEVDEKYYLSDEALRYMCKPATGGYSDRMSFVNHSDDITAGTITANHSKGIPYNVLVDNINNSDTMTKYGNSQDNKISPINGVSQTLSAGNFNQPKVLVKSATSKGYEVAEIREDSINFEQPNSETRRGRVGKGVAQTITTGCLQGVAEQRIFGWHENENVIAAHRGDDKRSTVREHVYHKESGVCTTIQTAHVPKLWGYRIRRLTPRECFRLMDFPDSFTWPVSDTQAYKQAGNSICVGVLAAIVERLRL